MEPVVSQEVDNTTPFASNPAPPVSGIRALPSQDDSDGESFMLSDGVPLSDVPNEGFSSDSGSISSASSDSEREEEELGAGKVGAFAAAETGIEEVLVAPIGEPVPEFPSPRAGVPIAKISVDDDDDVEEDEIEGFGIGSEQLDDLVTVTGSVIEDVDEEGDLEDKIVTKELNREGLDGSSELSSVVDAPSSAKPEVGVENGDAVVDSIIVDPTEVVRSGVAVVGEAVDNKDSEVDVVGNLVVDNVDVDETEPLKNGGEASETKETAADNSEAAVGVSMEAEEVQDSEARLDGLPVLENPELAIADIGEIHGAKITNQGDAVVDKISVDVIAAVQSGAAVVGDNEESIGIEAKENGSAVDESINTEELGSYKNGANATEAMENGSAVDKSNVIEPESSKHVENVTDATENGSVVDESIVTEPESYKHVAKVTEAIENGSVVDESIATEPESSKHDAIVTESTENGSVVAESIATEPDSSKHDTIVTEATENGSVADENFATETESSKHDAIVTEATENGSVVYESIGAEPESYKHETETIDAVAVPEASSEGPKSEALIANDRGLGKEDDKPETDDEDINGSTDGETDGMVFGSSAAARQFMKELERASVADSQMGSGSSHELTQEVDGQIVTDSEEEADSDNEQDGQELFDTAALAALLKAATNASVDPGNLTITSQDGTRLFSVERPAGLGSSLRPIRPSARPNSSSMFAPPGYNAVTEESLTEEERTKLEKLQQIRVKFLRLVYRLGHSAEDSVATQVLYRLALLAGRPSVPSFSLDVAKRTAQELEEGNEDVNLSLTILVLGKSGVGKSATINSIFGEDKVKINAFEPGTTAVSEINGIVNGVNVRVLDTPGLKSSALEQSFNRKVLASVKKFMKKSPPDIVLYVDRLDSQTKDLNDLPMLRSISTCLGTTIWRNAIVTLTHAACAPPDGPSGSPLSYEVFVAQRSHTIQQYIGQAVGDFRFMSPGMMNHFSLVENHLACRRNREGQKVLPNGQTWRPQLMSLCFSMKILSEATAVVNSTKPTDPNDPRKLFGFRVRGPNITYLLQSLMQTRQHPKLSAEQGGDGLDSDIDVDDFEDFDVEDEEDEYDQLPPFRPLRKAQINRLSKEQKKAYLEEYDYRVKLLQKKQWKEELKRMRDGKKNKNNNNNKETTEFDEYDPENETPAAVPVPLPDMALPPTFDSDNPVYRYRFLEPTSQFLARPVLDTHGWDHDCGYDGVNVEQNLAIVSRFPASITVQATKDKKDFNLHLDSSVAAKHGETGSSLAGFEIQNFGKQLGYIVKGETKFKNLKRNKTTAGATVTFVGESVSTGVKVEDQVSIGKRVVLAGTAGTVRCQKESAYGANFEVRLKDAEFPIGQDQSSATMTLIKNRGDLVMMGSLQSLISVGRNSKVAVRVSLNNKQSGQITVRTSSSDHLQLALAGLIPIGLSIFRSFRPAVSDNYSIY